MEQKNQTSLDQVIQEVKKIKFADPTAKKSWIVKDTRFVVDKDMNIDWVVSFTNWINLVKSLKNKYLKSMFVISRWHTTEQETFQKKYLR